MALGMCRDPLHRPKSRGSGPRRVPRPQKSAAHLRLATYASP